jgi:hypothetical protein
MRGYIRMVHWVVTHLGLVAVMVVGLVLGLVAVARSATTTIPERMDYACARLGRPAGCVLEYEAGKRFTHATVLLTVNDNVSEPGVFPFGFDHVSSLIMILRRPRVAVAQTYQHTGDSADCSQLLQALAQPPCVVPQCVMMRAWDAEYVGPRETDFVDGVSLLNRVLYQTPDDVVSDRLRALAGAVGLPMVTRVYANTLAITDESLTNLNTTIMVDVDIQFAL